MAADWDMTIAASFSSTITSGAEAVISGISRPNCSFSQSSSRCSTSSSVHLVNAARSKNRKDNGQYRALLAPITTQERIHDVSKEDEAYKWNRRLGNVSAGTIQKSIAIVSGVSVRCMNSIHLSRPCEVAKFKFNSKRSPRPKVSNESRRSTQLLDLVHPNVVGSTRQDSLK